jgi:hypothetical protein
LLNLFRAHTLMRAVAGTKWGMNPTTMLMLYKSLVRSEMEYCCLIYDKYHSNIRMLGVIQNRALRISLGNLNSTQIQSLEIISSVEPLQSRFVLLHKRFLVKIKSQRESLLENNISKLNERGIIFLNIEFNENPYVYRKFPFYDFKGDFKSNELNINLSVHHKIGRKGNLPDFTVRQIVNEERAKYPPHTIEIFTDGSKYEETASFGIYFGDAAENKCVKIIENCSIFIAEAKGIHLM